jgi:hypothetical protein
LNVYQEAVVTDDTALSSVGVMVAAVVFQNTP